MDIKTLSEKQRTFFNSGKTLETAYRLRALEKGFAYCASAPLVRSSYMAEEALRSVVKLRR